MRLSLVCIVIASLCAVESVMGMQKYAQITLNDKYCIKYYKIKNIPTLFGPMNVWGVEIGQALCLTARDKESLNQGFQVLATDDTREVSFKFQDRPFSVRIRLSHEIGKRHFSLKLVENKTIL